MNFQRMLTPPTDTERVTIDNEARITAMLSAIDRRTDIFGDRAATFGDPSWYMLLDLYLMHLKHVPVTISSIAQAGRTAQSTAIRHVSGLVKQGWVSRHADPLDKRRIYVRLTKEGQYLMGRWLAAITPPRKT